MIVEPAGRDEFLALMTETYGTAMSVPVSAATGEGLLDLKRALATRVAEARVDAPQAASELT